MSLACPRAEPDGWCSMMRVLGSAYRLPCRARSPGLGAPTPSAAGTGRHARPAWRTHARCAPVPALVPQSVTGRNYCMHLARPAGTLPASTRRRGARERPGRSPRPAQASMQPTPIPACSGRPHARRACARARVQGAAARARAFAPMASMKPLMPMHAPKPTVPTSLPMYFMVSNSARQGTTCACAPGFRVRVALGLTLALRIQRQFHSLASPPNRPPVPRVTAQPEARAACTARGHGRLHRPASDVWSSKRGPCTAWALSAAAPARCAHVAAGAVDVQLDGLLVLGVQVEHGGHQLVAQLLVDGLAQEDDPLAVLPRRVRPLICWARARMHIRRRAR